MKNEPLHYTDYRYLANRPGRNEIQSYGLLKLILQGESLEQNHLIHAAFFRNGPPETRHLVNYVPAIPLTQQEHRGAVYGYHTMKDGQLVGKGAGAFRGVGMDAYLASRGIRTRKKEFSREEISEAISASAAYWRMIGIEHAARAVEEFRTKIFENPVYQRASK